MGLFKKNDWYPVWVKQAEWTVTRYHYNLASWEYQVTENAIYEIEYSHSRNKYKLKLSGYCPKEHTEYADAVKKLNEYINKVKSNNAVGNCIPSE